MAPKKSKGKLEELDAEGARQLLQLLDRNERLPEKELQAVFKLGQPPCPPTCGAKGSKGNKDNPHCFCGLLPAEGSYRKKGLWQKEAVLGQLGHDPADDKRQTPDVPAGLRNLGNTCYVNAAMQFLHAIPDFRHALYVLEPDIAEQEIVRQLRDLFIELHFGPRRYVDPEPFANSLQLNHAIQQDGQEFLKLLLSKLESVFAASAQQEVVSVVQRLFRGHFSYVTTCRSCQQPSEGSKRQVEFYELPLQVQHMPSLQQSMVSALSPEELVGDNQYFCENCGGKCDAERQMRLRSLPPYLCLSLQRFVFDMQTFDKKKAMDKVTIPLLLDMGAVLTGAGLSLPDAAPLGPDGAQVLPGTPGAEYELAAVLIHKGTSASHGHYVAHIKMPDTGSWWRFDDEVAEEMGQQPTNFPADHGTTAQAQAAAAGGTAGDDGKAAAAGSKRGRGASAGAGTVSKRGRGGGAKGKGKKKNEWGGSDSEEEEDASSSKRGKGGRVRDRGRGRGKAGKQQRESGGFDDEEADMQEALRLSKQMQIDEQSAELAMLGVVSNSAQQHRQDAVGDAQDEAAEAAAQPESSRRKRKGAGAAAAAAEGKAAKKPAKGKGAAAAVADTAVAQPADNQLEIVSGNAYFLVYRQRISSIGSSTAHPAAAASAAADGTAAGTSGAAAAGTAAANGAAAAAGDGAAAEQPPAAAAAGDAEQQGQLHPHLLQQLQSLPDAVRERVVQLHQQFEQACATHQQMKQEALARVGQRQAEVRTISDMLPIQDASDPGCFIAAAWLEAWANGEDSPGPVDNGQLLCDHTQLSPDKPAAFMKHISTAAWQALVSGHKGGPKLGPSEVCRICLRAQLQGLMRSDALADLRESLLVQLAADEESGTVDDLAAGYYVSKSWLQGFKTRRGTGGGSLQPPTAGIACCHCELAPEALSGTAKRLVVSVNSWDMLKQLWIMQVLREVAARRAKAARAAARQAAAGGAGGEAAAAAQEEEDDGVTIIEEKGGEDDDGDVKIVDVTDEKQEAPSSSKQQQQQQQPLEDDDDDVEVIMHDDAVAGEAPSSSEKQQLQGERASSPGAAAGAAPAAGWQLPLPLDGSVELTEEQLLAALPVFHSVHAMECEQCRASLEEAAAGHQEVKQQLEAQKTALSKLLVGSVQETLELGVTYYLVPNDWITLWRSHLQAASAKKPSSSGLPPPPPPLPDVLRPLLCRCHPDNPGVAVPLPAIVNKRGRFAQADQQNDLLRVITQQDWTQLMHYHSGLPDSSDSSTPADAAASTDATAAGGGRGGGRARRSSAAKQSQQQRRAEQKAQKQEQLDLLLQRIASLADTDPAYKGIRATLQVEALPAEAGPAAAAVAVAAAGDGPVQQQQQGQQVQQEMNGLHEAAAQQPQQQQPQQQAEQQQQEPMDVDVLVSSPPQQLQVASVDLTGASPAVGRPGDDATAAAAAAGTAANSAGNAVEIVAEIPPTRFAAAAAAANAAAAAASGADQLLVDQDMSEYDPVGLEAAAARSDDDDWHPEDTSTQQQQQQQQQRGKPAGRGASRTTRRGAAAAAAADGGGDDDSAGGVNGPAAAVSAAASLRGWLVTVPAPCQQHLDAEAAARRAALLVYDDAEVMVELVQQDLAAAYTAAAGVERKSRRARKNRQPLKVCSRDTLAQLRLKVFEALSLHPKNQALYRRGTLMEGEQLMLAQLEVFPEEELRVVNTNEVPNDDYSSVFDGVSTGKRRREVETGFKDTALGSGSIPVAAAAAAPPTAAEHPAEEAAANQHAGHESVANGGQLQASG